jgi:hypothetical protein
MDRHERWNETHYLMASNEPETETKALFKNKLSVSDFRACFKSAFLQPADAGGSIKPGVKR